MKILLILLFVGQGLTIDVDVQTEYGTVRGHQIVVNLLGGGQKTVNSFLGIPFAKPPLADLRFEPPQKPEPWTEVFEADVLKSACVQDVAGVLWVTQPLWTDIFEDCLNLNIYTPEDISVPYPVMVWFFGGAFVSGANIQYPGHFLATKDVVVVVPNYRLGVFGFISSPSGALPGNAALYDQNLALQFVRDNIANFGGLSNRVTIFGQSAGAASTAHHQISPKSRGLFYQAIQESGTEQNFWSINVPAQQPEQYMFQVADNAGCIYADEAEAIACLKGLEQRDLRTADNITCTPGYFCQGFAPVMDGPGGFLPEDPRKMREELKEESVPLMSGICKDDGSLYVLFMIPEAAEGDGFNSTEFQYYFEDRILSIWAEQLTPVQYNNVLEAFMYYYTPWPYIEDKEANRQALNKMFTDGGFGYEWDRQGKTNTDFRDTFLYIMSYRSTNYSSLPPWDDWMGVPHMGELPYVWGYPWLLLNPDVRNDSQIYFDIIGYTPEDLDYAEYVMTLWTNFAKYGDPTPGTGVKAPFSENMTTWDKFRWDDNLKVLDLDWEVNTKENYLQRDYALYYDYLAYLIEKPIYLSASKTLKEKMKPSTPINSAMFREARTAFVTKALLESGHVDFEEMERALQKYEILENNL